MEDARLLISPELVKRLVYGPFVVFVVQEDCAGVDAIIYIYYLPSTIYHLPSTIWKYQTHEKPNTFRQNNSIAKHRTGTPHT